MGLKQTAFLAGVGAAVGLSAACGSVCDRAESVDQSLADKGRPCQSADAGVSVTFGNFDRNLCESNVKSCTSGDLDIINAQLECAEKIATCSPGNQQLWLASLLACARDLNQVTPSCLSATTGQ